MIHKILITLCCFPAALLAAEEPRWRLSSALQLQSTYDETMLQRVSPRDNQPTMISSLTPSLRLSCDELTVDYSLRMKQYNSIPSRNSLNHLGRFSYQTDIFNWKMHLSDSISHMEDSGGEADESISQPQSYLYNRALLRLSGPLKEKAIKLQIGVDHRDYEHRRKRDWMAIKPSWEVGMAHGVGQFTLRHDYSYNEVDTREAVESHLLLAGYDHKINGSVTMDVRGGALLFSDFGVADPAWRVTVTHKTGALSTSVHWSRSAAMSSTSQLVRRDLFRLQPIYTFENGLRLAGSASMIYSESLDNDRTDTLTARTGVDLSKTLRKGVTGTLTYSYVDQDARGSRGYDLHGSIVSMRLSVKY